MKATRWQYDEFDIIAMVSEYNYLGVNDESILSLFETDPQTIGDFTFIVGNQYTSIGYPNKTSAGFTFYDGEPLKYVGKFLDYLLFNVASSGQWINVEGYKYLFITFKILTDSALFTLTNAGAGRIIELSNLKTQQK